MSKNSLMFLLIFIVAALLLVTITVFVSKPSINKPIVLHILQYVKK
ncbi:TPA: hypothetical protein IAC10_13360 [Candidatus Scatousia excrementigallinarum]|uniref:Uncharacterized protein n=1 Tax=Candidatus Scatousia excrementigallinarum TaxID=2840935 RepID=A0A9D1F116_9BACT|nr:hypothetical protein [Candidatus Scatousia excrementigallinarum]